MAIVHGGPDSRNRRLSDVSMQPRALDQKPQSKDTIGFENTVLCAFYAKGLCTRGAECTFAHDLSQVRAKPDLTRTSLCRQFIKKGFCKNGDECKYAHGKSQLRGKEPSRTSRSDKVNLPQPKQDVAVPQSNACNYAWDPLGLEQRPERLSDSVELPSLIWLMKALVVPSSSNAGSSNEAAPDTKLNKTGAIQQQGLDCTGREPSNELSDLRERRPSRELQQAVIDEQTAPIYVKNTFLEFDIEPQADIFIRSVTGPGRLEPLATS